MPPPPTLRVYLHGGMLRSARAGTFPAVAVLARAVEEQGWRVLFKPASPQAHDSLPPPASMHCFT